MLVERPLGRIVNGIVRLHVSDHFDAQFREAIVSGVPFFYSNHQNHIDGFAYGVLSECVRRLAADTPSASPLRGIVMPIAKSFVEGQQGLGPRFWYNLFNSTLRSMGYLTLPATRKVDGKYGMSRGQMVAEMRPILSSVTKGYGVGLLPEGTVQGGRHPQGADVEDIYGMQRVNDDYLKGFYERVLKRVRGSGRGVFFVPMGVNGSFRFQYSPENVRAEGPPRVTKEGLRAFRQAFFGREPDVWIDARIRRIITVGELACSLGEDWLEAGSRLNDYLMAQVLPDIPQKAWGEYGRSIQHLTRAIELVSPS